MESSTITTTKKNSNRKKSFKILKIYLVTKMSGELRSRDVPRKSYRGTEKAYAWYMDNSNDSFFRNKFAFLAIFSP